MTQFGNFEDFQKREISRLRALKVADPINAKLYEQEIQKHLNTPNPVAKTKEAAENLKELENYQEAELNAVTEELEKAKKEREEKAAQREKEHKERVDRNNKMSVKTTDIPSEGTENASYEELDSFSAKKLMLLAELIELPQAEVKENNATKKQLVEYLTGKVKKSDLTLI